MPDPADPLPPPVPRYFGPADRSLFGWLHGPPPSPQQKAVGVVICRPLGYEGLCCYRSMRHLALTAAAAGFPTLRFDYDGTGDSAGGALADDRWQAWHLSVDAAIEELKAASGVDTVCLVGVRLGAPIATLVAAARSDVSGLVTIAPVTAGSQWLREVRALEATMGRAAPPEGRTLPAGAIESLGLLLTPDTISAIRGVDLRALQRAPAPKCLVLDRDDRPPTTDWCAHLKQLGSDVDHRIVPGFVEMMLAPHEAQVPEVMIREFRSWLTEHADTRTPPARVSPPATRTGPIEVAPGVAERAVFLDDAQSLFGVATCPVGGQTSRTLIVLNSGGKHRIGNGGMYVTFARRLATRGWSVLRFDLAGIGDSPPHPASPENDVYTSHATKDLEAAVRFARSNLGAHRVEVAGLCSGAYHAFKGAAAGLAIDGVTIINPLVFDWKPGMSLAYPPYQMVQAVAQYKRSVLRFAKWVDVVRGRVDVREITKVVSRRSLDQMHGLLRNLRRVSGVSPSDDLGVALSDIAGRGVALRFVFSAGDPGEALLREGAGWVLPALQRRGLLRVSYLPDCDHSLSAWWMRELLWDELLRGLEGP